MQSELLNEESYVLKFRLTPISLERVFFNYSSKEVDNK